MGTKQITFIPVSEEAENLVHSPVPAYKAIPDWWKRIPAFARGNSPTYLPDGSVDSTVKMCVPFADTLRFGYLQLTWMDIHIESDETGRFRYSYPGTPDIFKVRESRSLDTKTTVVINNNSYLDTEFAWRTQWVPKLPKGYSALITHPFNREELPFVTMTGIVDADKYHHDLEGEHPFLVKKGFVGTIPAGTPMYQIIPFKRDNWISSKEPYSRKQLWKGLSLKHTFWGAYKNEYWSKKSFK